MRSVRISFHYVRSSSLATGGGRRFASVAAGFPLEPQDESSRNGQVDVFSFFRRSFPSTLAMSVKRRLAARVVASQDPEFITTTTPTKTMSLDEREQLLYTTLQNRQPDQIMNVMRDVQNKSVIEQLPDSVFVSAFLLLTPEHFLEPYKKILGRVHDHALRVKGYQPFKYVMKGYLTDLVLIFQMRLAGGNRIGLAEHTLMLRWAASVGDLSIALLTWKSIEKNGITPDVECYNLILASSLWDRVNGGKERYRLTVTRHYMNKRRKRTDKRRKGYKGFGVKSHSVRIAVQRIVGQMRELEIPTNAATYANLLLAYARVGYLGGVKSILKSIWGVDADKLAADELGEEEEGPHPPVVEYSPSSPLYPSKEVLWTIAHAFGICCDLASALRTVNFMSEQYQVKITPDAWVELFERAYVLSKPQFNKNKPLKPPPNGQVPLATVDKIYDMMEPAPTHSRMHVYRKLARMAQSRRYLQRYSHMLETAYKFFDETRQKRQRALQLLETRLGFSLKIDPQNTPFGEAKVLSACRKASVWQALREYEILRLEVMQQRLQLERMVALGLGTGRWQELRVSDDHKDKFYNNRQSMYKTHNINNNRSKNNKPTGWTRQLLPEFLAEWRDFLPECFYVTLAYHGGKIEFHGRTTYLHQNIRPHLLEPVRRSRCGEFPLFADHHQQQQQLEPIDDYLWSHIRARLGPLAEEEPFAGFFARNWARMDDPGENFLWIAEQEMVPLDMPREGGNKFTRRFPESFWKRMVQRDREEGRGLMDVRLLIEEEMRDGSYQMEMMPFGRWY